MLSRNAIAYWHLLGRPVTLFPRPSSSSRQDIERDAQETRPPKHDRFVRPSPLHDPVMETLGAVPRRRGWLGLVWGKGEEEREKGRYAKGEVKRKGEKKKETHHEYRIEINKTADKATETDSKERKERRS